MSEPAERPSVVPLLWYEKPRDAIAWLEQALGFEARMIVGGDEMEVIHSELAFGNGALYVVGPSSPGQGGASPLKLGGQNTQNVHLNLTGGLDAHCERARAAGAKIVREPADQPYGDRVYTCVDPEGHAWSFSQPAKIMTAAEMAEATGRKIETPRGA
jgi:uncharacterized glyoxalase superfamily protein PhnB